MTDWARGTGWPLNTHIWLVDRAKPPTRSIINLDGGAPHLQCLLPHGHDMASLEMWHKTEWFLILMAHKTRPYKMWHLDYPLSAIPMNICTRTWTSGCQWCFEPGHPCASPPSRCSQNLYPCTTLLIYQKHGPHRIGEVFGQLIQSSKSRPPELFQWT